MRLKTINELKKILKKQKNDHKKIGLVPTMGYLHEGHLSLIRRAKLENDFVIVSIFVNPTQFTPNEDFEQYPSDINRDYDLAINNGADIIFNPKVDEMYIPGVSTFVHVEGEITKKLCGASRPTHFKGVTTIVNMLFNIITPENAYFGQKDAQQVIIIKKMVKDLHMNVNIVVCPIVRENDGLALSSRNIYLSKEERAQALILNESLTEVKLLFHKNNKVSDLRMLIIDKIKSKTLANIDYVEILDANSLEEIEIIARPAIAAVAVKFGKTRLIDNILLGEGTYPYITF